MFLLSNFSFEALGLNIFLSLRPHLNSLLQDALAPIHSSLSTLTSRVDHLSSQLSSLHTPAASVCMGTAPAAPMQEEISYEAAVQAVVQDGQDGSVPAPIAAPVSEAKLETEVDDDAVNDMLEGALSLCCLSNMAEFKILVDLSEFLYAWSPAQHPSLKLAVIGNDSLALTCRPQVPSSKEIQSFIDAIPLASIDPSHSLDVIEEAEAEAEAIPFKAPLTDLTEKFKEYVTPYDDTDIYDPYASSTSQETSYTSSEGLEPDDDSDTVKKKRKAKLQKKSLAKMKAEKKKKKKNLPPLSKSSKKNIPFYKIHNLPLTVDTPVWQRYSSEERKQRKIVAKEWKANREMAKLMTKPSVSTTSSLPAPVSSNRERSSRGGRSSHVVSAAPVSPITYSRQAKAKAYDLPPPGQIDPISTMARFLESKALDQIRKAKEADQDTSQISTMSSYRRQELSRYSVGPYFDEEEYMKLHPEAIVITGRKQTVIGLDQDEEPPSKSTSETTFISATSKEVYDAEKIRKAILDARKNDQEAKDKAKAEEKRAQQKRSRKYR